MEVVLSDYRNIQGKFDRIVSIEMLEAVGHEYHETYFKKCNEVLKEDGAMCFQVITCPDSKYEEIRNGVDFIQKHIFPGSLIPSISRLNEVINKTSNMVLFQLEDIGLSYAKTLKCWLERFDLNLNRVKEIGFNERFIKKWRYYLQYCEAAFETRNISVVQMVYTRPNNIRF